MRLTYVKHTYRDARVARRQRAGGRGAMNEHDKTWKNTQICGIHRAAIPRAGQNAAIENDLR